MPATSSGQLTVEKTPSYLVSGRVVERVFAMDRGVRLLVVVRDPVTRAVSDYTQAAAKRPDIAPFERLAFVAPHRNVTDHAHLGIVGSRPSDHYFRSVCLSVCLIVCLCRVFLSRL